LEIWEEVEIVVIRTSQAWNEYKRSFKLKKKLKIEIYGILPNSFQNKLLKTFPLVEPASFEMGRSFFQWTKKKLAKIKKDVFNVKNRYNRIFKKKKRNESLGVILSNTIYLYFDEKPYPNWKSNTQTNICSISVSQVQEVQNDRQKVSAWSEKKTDIEGEGIERSLRTYKKRHNRLGPEEVHPTF